MKHNLETSLVVAAVTTFASLAVVGVIFWHQKKKSYQNLSLEDVSIPTKWTKVGEVKEVAVYPLKGGKRRMLDQADATKLGLIITEGPGKLILKDRLFVLFDEKHQFLSIRKNTKVLFVETTAVNENTVKFSYPGSEDLIFQLPEENKITKTYVELKHNETVATVDCGDAAAAWFSQSLLGKPSGLRMGVFLESVIPPRSIKGTFDKYAKAYKKFHNDYMGTFHNLASYLILSEASVKDLNTRITREPVTEHYFRPNIIVKGSPAYSEDTWDWIKIGDDVILRGFKKCIRCPITTINPDTAARDPKIEPLKTLRTYRQIEEPELRKVDGESPVMGLYAGCHQYGTIRVGDPVYTNSE